MTYMKYVEISLCCFIPGKVIDEIYRVLRFIQNNPNPPRVHELLQELRDISSMAMEYFEEKIAPSLKSKMSANNNSMASVVVPMSPSMTRSQKWCLKGSEEVKANCLLLANDRNGLKLINCKLYVKQNNFIDF